jgi:hypothetical protein
LFKGIKTTNYSYHFVAEYFNKKMLSKMGYRFDAESLTEFDVDVFSEITSRLAELEKEESKKASKKPRRK